MRSIGSFQTDLAQRFTDFLNVKSIPAKTDPVSDEQSTVWIRNEDQVEAARKELDKFIADPNAEVYRLAEGKAREMEQEKKKKQEKIARLSQEANAPKPFFHKTPLVLLFLVISVVVFFLGGGLPNNSGVSSINSGYFFNASSPHSVKGLESFFVDQSSSEESISDSVWFKSASVRSGHFWRLVTPIFLHGDPLHLLFNMIWLVIFGRLIERREGTQFLFWLAIFCAVLSNSCQAWAPGWLGGSRLGQGTIIGSETQILFLNFGGFSGVVYGMFGYIWMRGTWARVPEYQLSPLFLMIMMAFMLFGFIGVDSLMGSNTANWGHGVGFFSGIFFGSMPIGKSKEEAL